MLSVCSNHNLQTVLCILSIHFSNWGATPYLTPFSAFRHASLTRYGLQYKIKYANASAKLKRYIRFWNCREQSPVGGLITIQMYTTFYKSSTSDKGADVIFFHVFFQTGFSTVSSWKFLLTAPSHAWERHEGVCELSTNLGQEKERTGRGLTTEVSDAAPGVRKP